MQMNSCLKEMSRDKDFKESASMLFGDKERKAGSSSCLNKDPGYGQASLGFSQWPLPKTESRRGGSHYSGHYKQRGWQPSNSKTAQKLSSKNE